MKKIIALAGRKGSGKSEISKTLSGFKKISFADYLREIISKLYNVEIERLKNPIHKESKLIVPLIWDEDSCKKLSQIVDEQITYTENDIKIFWNLRQVLQFIGTDVLKKHDPLFHVKKTVSSLKDENYTCDDLRFESERQALVNLTDFEFSDFYIIKPDNWQISNHVSEISLNWTMFDKIIINDGTISHLIDTFNKTINPNQEVLLTSTVFLDRDVRTAAAAGFIYKFGTLIPSYFGYPIFNVVHEDFNLLNKLMLFLNGRDRRFASYRYHETFMNDEKNLFISSPFILENLKWWSPQDHQHLTPELKEAFSTAHFPV